MAVSIQDAVAVPWHWARTIQMSEYVESICEAAGLDPEGLVAPRSLWFREELKEWYRSREELRRGD